MKTKHTHRMSDNGEITAMIPTMKSDRPARYLRRMKRGLLNSAMAAVLMSAGADGSVGGEVSEGEPLGIERGDVAAMAAMTGQPFLREGLLDVTKPPFLADPTGAADATAAIRDAVAFARTHKLAVWLPIGTYTVNDTIPCAGGWVDWRTSRFLPFCETWPCVLIGERKDGRRPLIMLQGRATDFGDPENPKPVFDFHGNVWSRGKLHDEGCPFERPGATSYNQLLYGIDVKFEDGNPGAVVVTFDSAEGSTLQDCRFDLGNGFAGVLGGPGSGGAIFNVVIHGGQYGMVLNSSRPTCTVAGSSFVGQKKSSVVYSQRGPLVLVGCRFEPSADASAVVVRDESRPELKSPKGHRYRSLAVIDSVVEYKSVAKVPAIVSKGGVYLANVSMRGAATVLALEDGAGTDSLPDAPWTVVKEAAFPYMWSDDTMKAVIYRGETRGLVPHQVLLPAKNPSDPSLQHILWDSAHFPSWNNTGVVDVTKPPYSAVPDGETDVTAILQRAINEHEILFLPKGAYRITKTLELRPNTKIIGVSPAYSMICPFGVSGGDFADPEKPRPAIRTAESSDAQTQLAFFSVFMPREDAPGAAMLEWRAGGESFTRCVNPITGYTDLEIIPLRAGVRPWHIWDWSQIPEVRDYRGTVFHHYHDEKEAGQPGFNQSNWPIVTVTGNGAGGFYPFYALDGRTHGPNRRRILVENCKGPFRLYHAHFQYCPNPELEISGSSNVSVYGIKNEGKHPLVRIADSDNILIAGHGGPGLWPEEGKFVVVESRRVTLTNLTNDWSPKRVPLVRIKQGGVESATAPGDNVILLTTE